MFDLSQICLTIYMLSRICFLLYAFLVFYKTNKTVNRRQWSMTAAAIVFELIASCHLLFGIHAVKEARDDTSIHAHYDYFSIFIFFLLYLALFTLHFLSSRMITYAGKFSWPMCLFFL